MIASSATTATGTTGDTLLDDYCFSLLAAGQSPRTIATRRRQLRMMLRSIPDPVTATHRDLVHWLADPGWAPATRSSNRAAARGFIKWLRDSGHRPDDPAASLPPVRVPAPVPHPAPERALANAREHADDDFQRLMVELAARCGLRRREIATLRFSDVLESDEGWLLRVLGKGNKVRVIPVPDDVVAMINAVRNDYIFPSRTEPNAPMSPDHVGHVLSRLLGPGFSGHSLRHRFATKAYGATHDLLAVQQLLGHSSPQTTQGYVRVDQDDLRRAAQAAS